VEAGEAICLGKVVVLAGQVVVAMVAPTALEVPDRLTRAAEAEVALPMAVMVVPVSSS